MYKLTVMCTIRCQNDFLKKRLSICWAVVAMHHCDWHSCFRAVRQMMWLAESVFIDHHTLQSIFHFAQPFCTLRWCTSMKQHSKCAWRRPHSPCAQDQALCARHCTWAIKIDPDQKDMHLCSRHPGEGCVGGKCIFSVKYGHEWGMKYCRCLQTWILTSTKASKKQF